MDVWGTIDEESLQTEEHEPISAIKDVLLLLIDIRGPMFSPYKELMTEAGHEKSCYFYACVQLAIKLLKSKIIARDKSSLGIFFIGSKRSENSLISQVYEFQALASPSATNIRALKELYELSPEEIMSEYQSMDVLEALSFSNALWFSGIALSNLKLKMEDSQRIWIFTNDDEPKMLDDLEPARVQAQAQNHVDFNRNLTLFYMHPPHKPHFQLSLFYKCIFTTEAAIDRQNKVDEKRFHAYQPAFFIRSLDSLYSSLLRKQFQKRRLTTFAFHLSESVAIGVELYANVVFQRKSLPVFLRNSSNMPLQSEVKYLCEETGAYLDAEQIQTYVLYGNAQVSLSKSEIGELKSAGQPGLGLIGFRPVRSLCPWDNLRAPYFLYPSDGWIANSSKAFLALLRAMKKKELYALARFVLRQTSEPRLVALVPQEEVEDELGQVQPTGFQVVFLPYLNDIRTVEMDTHKEERVAATEGQVQAAVEMLDQLTLPELPIFENPGLQKHYASIQALALEEDSLEYDESNDSTLPDEEGFQRPEIQASIIAFRQACGHEFEVCKRKAKETRISPAGCARGKRRASVQAGADIAMDIASWRKRIESGQIEKETVKTLQAFLQYREQPIHGRKAQLIDRIQQFVQVKKEK